MPEMKSLTLNGTTYDNFVDQTARSAAVGSAIINSASGENITLTDASKFNLMELHIYGKTTQNGTPTPDAPVELESVGDSGSITVNVTGEKESQSMVVSTPNGLPGIPVASDGNYTDENGQQWICDEIDFARGVRIQRINKYIYTGQEAWEKSAIQGGALSSAGLIRYDASSNPRHPKVTRSNVVSTHCLYAGPNAYNKDSGMSVWVAGDANISYLSLRIAIDIETPEALKAWLKEQYDAGTPLTILYILGTPIETPLSEEELAAYADLHTYRDNTMISNDASAHMDIEYVMDGKKYIDSLIASGGMSTARLTTITIRASEWSGSDSLYSQVVTVEGVKPNSKVDLLPSVEQLAIFHNKDVAFVTENENGVVTVYAIGDKPLLDYTMQAQITEVVV